MTNSHKKFMKLVVQIDYKFLSCKDLQLAKRHTLSNSKHAGKNKWKNDFKCILSNLQHQDHKITTNDDTSFDSLGFPIYCLVYKYTFQNLVINFQ